MTFPVSAIKDAEKVLDGKCIEYDTSGCKIEFVNALTKSKIDTLIMTIKFVNYSVTIIEGKFRMTLIWEPKN